jgi:hypothetical protein
MPPPVKLGIQTITVGLPPIKLDGKVYFVAEGTYTRTYSEKLITEEYTTQGEFDRQMLNTGKDRFKMTLLVVTDTSNVEQVDGVLADLGDIDDLHTSAAKEAPLDELDYYDISTDWDFSGTKTHTVFLKLGEEAPHNNDIGTWQVPIELWGEEYSP